MRQKAKSYLKAHTAMGHSQGSRIIHTYDTLKLANFNSIVNFRC